MKLYDYQYKKSKLGETSLIVVIDTGGFNNNYFHIHKEEIEKALNIIEGGTEEEISQYLESVYHDEFNDEQNTYNKQRGLK